MLTTVNIGALRSAVQQAMHTLDSKSTSVGSLLYLFARAGKDEADGKLYIYSSNLGMARTLTKVAAKVTKDGEVLILPKLLSSILASLPEDETIDLALSANGSKMQVKYGTLKSDIAVHADAQKATEVLKTIPFNAKPRTSVSAATLVDLVNRTIFCTASGTASISEGPWLSSLSLEAGDGAIMGTATNRIIAGQAKVHDGLVVGPYAFGVHREALGALKALLSNRAEEEVTLTDVTTGEGGANEVLFRFSDVILGVRQLSVSYPKQVAKIFTVPDAYQSATITRSQLLSVFGRLSAFAEGNSFTLSFAADKVTVATRGYNSIFQEQVAKIEKTEGTITIGLGIADMVNVLNSMRAEEVIIRYKTADDHVHMQEGSSDFRYVLSPVQVSWAKGK